MRIIAQNYIIEIVHLRDSVFAFYGREKRFLLSIIIILLSLLGTILFFWATSPYGIGIRTDSVAYLWSARNLANGIGLGTLDTFGQFKPLNHFPPFYPILLAAFEVFKINGMVGALWIGAFCTALLIILSGVILTRLTNRSLWFPTFGVLIILIMQSFWATFLYAMTEPLYIICSLSGIICLDNYSTTSKRRWLLLSAILFGTSFLTRYIGISVIATGLLFLIFQKTKKLRQKLIEAVVLGSISITPMLIWLIRNKVLTGSETNRNLFYIPITAQEWKSTYETLMTWVAPLQANIKVNTILLILFLVSLVLAYFILRGNENGEKPTTTKLSWLLSLYLVTYLIFLLFSRLWFDPTIPLYEDRILYPLLISIIFLIFFCLHRFLDFVRKHSTILYVFMTGILVTFAWIFFRYNISAPFPFIYQVLWSHKSGLGLQARNFLNRDFQELLTQLPIEDLYFSDNVEELYFFSQRSSSYVGNLTTTDINLLREQSSKREILLVFFQSSLEIQQSLQQQIPRLQLLYSDASGRSILVGKPLP
jgi:hypothetical protein